jgi:DNA repair exonuclease SbcCD ATPase subunit
MAYQLEDLLKGLDEPTIKNVTEHVKAKAKELDAKLFIDGDGQHYVPHARFDEVVQQRDQANNSIEKYKTQVSTLSKQVEDGSDAQATIQKLQGQLEAQTQIAKSASVISALHPLISDSIAPAADILGFMNLDNITVEDDGKVKGLDEELKAVRESRKYLFKEVETPNDPKPESSSKAKAGTGNLGNSGRVGSGTPEPREVGSFGKQLAAAQQPAGEQPQTSFFK